MAGTEWPGAVHGGLQVYFAELARRLAARHEVFGLVQGPAPGTENGLRLISCAPDAAGAVGRVLAFRRAARAVAAGGVDLFNPHFAPSALGPLYGGLPDKVPVVCHFQGPWAREGWVEDRGSHGPVAVTAAARYAGKTLVERLVYRRCDRFVVLSEASAGLLVADYGVQRDRIAVIPAGVDLERFQPVGDRREARRRLGLPLARPVLLTVRRLAERMGLDRLLEAMELVARRVPDALLLIGGDGPLRGVLDEQARRLGLGAWVRFLGAVPDPQLPAYLTLADVVVVPSRALEGFGLATLEALACGTPVVGTPTPATSGLLSGLEPGLVCEDFAAPTLAAKLVEALLGPAWLPSRAACRSFAERYGWDRVVPRVEAVFHEALGGAR